MNLTQIKEAVEKRLQISLESKIRDREHADGRALYYKLSREYTHHTFNAIGKEVKRAHSSVIHGINNIFIHVDQDLYQQIKLDFKSPSKYITNIKRSYDDNIIVTNKY
jgi:chromosomal replication initiation ATPase DnaA